VHPGVAYWLDIYVPASTVAEPGGKHLCVVISSEAGNNVMGMVAVTMASRPERKRVPIDTYRVRSCP
jgi:mRNA-degrading endonuclease toxin of MazEF toxin-antitoxin module